MEYPHNLKLRQKKASKLLPPIIDPQFAVMLSLVGVYGWDSHSVMDLVHHEGWLGQSDSDDDKFRKNSEHLTSIFVSPEGLGPECDICKHLTLSGLSILSSDAVRKAYTLESRRGAPKKGNNFYRQNK